MPEKKLRYSEQAEIMLSSMPGFDKEDFERWFFEGLTAGSNNILMYLMEKSAEKIKEKGKTDG